uniref:Uncharacterized protein n=1 Tax=Gibberella zeae TaxID=5518 RepID=A0A4E9DY58_GIBZA
MAFSQPAETIEEPSSPIKTCIPCILMLLPIEPSSLSCSSSLEAKRINLSFPQTDWNFSSVNNSQLLSAWNEVVSW